MNIKEFPNLCFVCSREGTVEMIILALHTMRDDSFVPEASLIPSAKLQEFHMIRCTN